MRLPIDSDGSTRKHRFMRISLQELGLAKSVELTTNCIKRMLSIWPAVLNSGSRKLCSSQ